MEPEVYTRIVEKNVAAMHSSESLVQYTHDMRLRVGFSVSMNFNAALTIYTLLLLLLLLSTVLPAMPMTVVMVVLAVVNEHMIESHFEPVSL